jgi:hypothetical protein
MIRRRVAPASAVLLSVGVFTIVKAARASAEEAAAPAAERVPPACDAPPDARAPDPRCGETIDGRAPAEPENGVARGVLTVPRVATRALLWPVVETSDVLEHHHVLDWMAAVLTTDDGLVGVRPILSYTTGFAPSLGLRVFWRRLPGPHELAAHLETAGPGIIVTRLHFRTLARMGLNVDASWVKRDDYIFAGIGPNSEEALEASGRGLARYGSSALAAEARWSHWLPARLFVLLRGDVLGRSYQDGSVRGGPPVSTFYALPSADCMAMALPASCISPSEMPGFETGLRLVRGGGGLGLDLRAPGREAPGFFLVTEGVVARGIASDPSRHAKLSGEAVGVVGGANRAFVLRGRAAVVEKLGDAPIPFEELIVPSGAAGMRGFPEGRFRGESGVVGTAEYRWYISSYLDASLFSDVGTVAGHDFAGLGSARWFPSYGVGFRWFKTEGPYWEAPPRGGVQAAYAPDYGFRIILSMAGF